MSIASAGGLPIFAYGTLKEGFDNHAAYCTGATEVHAAHAWGRLFVHESGVPIMQVPDESMLLMGTRDRGADLVAGASVVADRTPAVLPAPPGRGWRKIRGELILFPDPEPRLKILDALEGFHPSQRERVYERILMPIQVTASKWAVEHVCLAWAYVLPPYADEPEDAFRGDTWKPWRA